MPWTTDENGWPVWTDTPAAVPTINTTDEFVDESVWDGEGSYFRKVANPNYVAPKPTTLEGMLQKYNQSNFDVSSAASRMRELGKQYNLTDADLMAAVPVFGDEHRSALNSGYTEGSNYNAIAQRAVSDALKTRGVDTNQFTQATQGYVSQGANEAQQRWQETQKDDSFGSTGLGQLTSMAVQALASYFGGPIGSAASSYALSGGDVGKAALSAGLTYAGGQLTGTGSGAPGGSWYSPSGDISSVADKVTSAFGSTSPSLDISGGLDAPGIATSYPGSIPTTLQGLNATDITNPSALTAAQQDALSKVTIDNNLASNVYGNAPVVDMSTVYDPASQTFAANSGNVTAGLTGSGALGNLVGGETAVGAAAGAEAAGAGGAATASGVGATQAAGAGLTAAQILSGASTAVGAGSLLGSFMDSVSSNPIMKALQAGQGIAGIVSGMTSTQGMISPEQARAMADPFASSRQQYIDQLNALMANPSLTTSTPGYQFNLQQGLAGIDARQAKSGVSRTGAGDIGVQQYGQQQAMSSFDQQVKNLSGLSGASVNPAQGATAALTAQNQQVSQRNAGWQAIGQGIGGVGQSLARGVGATQPGGYSITNPDVNTNYTQGYDPSTPSMQPMGGYVADPTIGAQGDGFWDGYSGQTAPPQNYWGI